MKTAAASLRSICYVLACLLLAGTVAAQPNASLEHTGAPLSGTLADCTGFEDYQQPLDTANFGTARTSDAETAFTVSEDFVDGAGMITPIDGSASGLKWWGLEIVFPPAPCTTSDDAANTPYDITFYADSAGAPGAVIATATGVVPVYTDTAVPFAFTTIGEYTASFPDIDVTGAAWVSVVRQVGVPGCQFLWVDETLVGSYDDIAHQDGAVPPALPSDHIMCLAAGVPFEPIVNVPTLGQFGLLALLASLLGAGIYRIRRNKQ